jgi:hypothetical protein
MAQKPVFLKIRVSQYLTKDEKRYIVTVKILFC